MRIGIFGGSFNPPHKMHKDIALNLLNGRYLDQVIYVPTGNKYNKPNLIEARHRYNMLKIMIDDEPNLKVSDYEIKSTLTYTYQTLNYFRKKYPNDEIYFICGSDNLKEFTTWKNYKYILDNYKILVIKRDDVGIDEIIKNLSSQNIIVADILLSNISSTMIRKKLKQKKFKNLINEIDEKVLTYIEKQKIYWIRGN